MNGQNKDKQFAKFQAAVGDFQAGNLSGARKKLIAIHKARPDIPEVLHLRGIIEFELQHPDVAVRHLQRAAELTNDAPAIVNALGVALLAKGDAEQAISAFAKALAQDSQNGEVHLNLGNALQATGNHEDAVESYEAALRHVGSDRPERADILFNMGVSVKAQGDQEKALYLFLEAEKNLPGQADAPFEAGLLQFRLRHLEDACHSLRRAAERDPDSWNVQNELGVALKESGLIGEAIRHFHRALELGSEAYLVENNLGAAYHQSGRIDQAIEHFRAAMAAAPDNPTPHSNLIFSMNCSAAFSAEDLLAEAQAWDRRHSVGSSKPAAAREKDRLRIGYVSADFHQHPVGSFIENAVREHDRDRFEIFCYSNGFVADDMNRKIRAETDHWRDIALLDDGEAAPLISGDGIDILIDLSGHSSRNRLPLFARRLAPVQITGIGVFCTSGLAAMDFIIGDRHEVPAGTEGQYSETVLLMPDDCVCYCPPEYLPRPAPAPHLEKGFITFGSFNNLSKVSPQAVTLWSEVLRAVPQSRILMKTHALGCPDTQAYYRNLFSENGIGAERIVLEGGVPHRELLQSYERVDIALDPFPYSGGLTTIEALLMGVPVVTLAGETFAARHTDSHLANAGFEEWIATDEAGYMDIARRLAMDPEALSARRRHISESTLASPICDGPGYTRNLEALYRQAWAAVSSP